MTFLIGGLMGAVTWPFRKGAIASLRQGWQVWLLGVGGLFGYHFVYFSAIRAAPAVEVSLIAYLWPLFLVVFSAFLPGERLKLHHLVGVALGLAGAVVIITRRQGLVALQVDSRRAMRWPLPARSSGRAIRCCHAASARFRPMLSPGSA